MDYFLEQMACWTIGPDKVNQLRHALSVARPGGNQEDMLRHAEITRPKFELVLNKLEESFSGLEMGTWIRPGGHFISRTYPDMPRK